MGKISFVNCLLRIPLCNAWNFPSIEFHMETLQSNVGIISIDQSVMKQWLMEMEYLTLLPFLASPMDWNIFESTNSTFGLFATKNITINVKWAQNVCQRYFYFDGFSTFAHEENKIIQIVRSKLEINIAIGDSRYNYKSIKWLCRLAQFIPWMSGSFLSNKLRFSQ